MYYPPPHFWHQLEQRLRDLEDNYQRLAQENKELQEQITQLKPVHIENINYKIQELVVKELSGTLNIGMTGLTDPEELAKWSSGESVSEEQEVHLNDLEQTEEETITVQHEQNDKEDLYG